MKKINLILLLIVISFGVLLFGKYKSYTNIKNEQSQQIKKENESKPINKEVITIPEISNNKDSKENKEVKTSNNITYNLSIESNASIEHINKMKRISEAIIKRYNYANGKEEAENLKNNFEEKAIDYFCPGMTFEELEKSESSSSTTDNKLIIEKRNDADYTVYFSYTLRGEKFFDKYIINFYDEKISFKENFYFKVG